MRTVQLGEIADIDRWGVDPTSVSPDTRYLGLEHIERGGRIIGSSTVADAELKSTKFRFTSDHVLYGKLRPNLGKISRPAFTGVCSTDILPIRPGENLDRNYLAHYLSQKGMVDFAASQATGANLPRLNPTVLASFPIPLPGLDEQRRIASILDHADALRTKRRQALAHLDSLTQSIFHEMFGELPLATDFGNVIRTGPTNGLYKPQSAYGTGTPILRIDGFSKGRISPRPWRRVRLTRDEEDRYALKVGDIVVNRVNALSHLGKSALVESLDEPSVYESNMMRISLNEGAALPEYVIAWFQSRSAKQQVLSRAKKAINQASINQTDVRSLLMPLPSLDQQLQFSTRIRKLKRIHVTLSRGLDLDDEIFATLQSRAFRGEL
ncbi:restriction endonuclease subunit S [Citricoccus nitrophenolicus]|uniref:restriction endonuclease subunit S n=1 Tax=Citricoccus nitrophenolicus TaxID=863575 RepID=UPI0031F0D585